MTKLRVQHADGAEPLVRFAFGAELPGGVTIACPRLAGQAAAEVWIGSEVTERGERACAQWRRDCDHTLVVIAVPESGSDIEAASAEAYRQLMRVVRPSRHPFILRIWNYIDAINAGDGDDERYRRFCVGRAAAVDDIFHTPPPAATAIGTATRSGVVQLIALCSHTPGIALENPRQTPAWQYPREFGPVSPGFSRGVVVGEGDDTRLLASGTASIVGHVSQHVGDAAAQLRESLANLEVLLDQGARASGHAFALERFDALRVYVRDMADLAAVQAALAPRITLDRVLFLLGDICRRELLVELEGVFVAGATRDADVRRTPAGTGAV